MVALGSLIALPANPALAATRSISCSTGSGYVRVDTDSGSTVGRSFCYTGSGSIALNIGYVRTLRAGANTATFTWEADGRYYKETYRNFQNREFSKTVRLVEIGIQ